MIEISLTQNKFTIIDDKYFDLISQYKWYVHKNGNNYYVMTHDRQVIYMHRLILENKLGRTLQKNEEVDHINMNSLDNRECNLRVCTKSQNAMNKNKQKGSYSSIYKGVYWNKKTEKWRSKIMINGKSIHLGLFHNEEEAAKIYNKASERYFKDFAKPNVIIERQGDYYSRTIQ